MRVKSRTLILAGTMEHKQLLGAFGNRMRIINPYRYRGLPPGEIHHWDFSIGSGSTVPDLIGGRDGTLAGGASWSGGGVLIDGLNQEISLGSVTSTDALSGVPSGEISVIAKVNWNGTPSAIPRIIEKTSGPGGIDGWSLICIVSASRIGSYVDEESVYYSESGLLTGTKILGWSLRGAGGSGRYYVGGSQLYVFTITKSFSSSTTPARIGNFAAGDRQLGGTILRCVVWDRLLTAEEHAAVAALWA